jgi:uncharacterized protein involved in exopolysaccharide biosynthesis
MINTTEDKKVENDEIDLIEVFKKIWDGRKTIYKSVAVCFVIGLIIAIGSPKEYKSEVTLLVETSSGTSGMSGLLQQFGGLAGINLGGAAGEEALTPELYPDIIKSTPFLLEVMDSKVTDTKYDSTLRVSEFLDRHTRGGVMSFVMGYTIGLPGKIIGWIKGKPKEEIAVGTTQYVGPLKLTNKQASLAGALAKRITAKQGESVSTLIIGVEMQDPRLAAQITDSVVKCLTAYVVDYRTQKAKVDLRFVEERHKEAEIRYNKAQQSLAYFRDQNRNIVLASAQTTEQNLQAEYNLAFNIYNTLSQQLEQAKMKVQEKTPVFKVMDPAKVPLEKSKPKTSLVLIGMIFFGGVIGVSVILVIFFLKLSKE